MAINFLEINLLEFAPPEIGLIRRLLDSFLDSPLGRPFVKRWIKPARALQTGPLS